MIIVFIMCIVVLSLLVISMYLFRVSCGFVFQAEDGIRDLVRSRGLGDVYKRQLLLGIPLVILYEISIIISKLSQPKQSE